MRRGCVLCFLFMLEYFHNMNKTPKAIPLSTSFVLEANKRISQGEITNAQLAKQYRVPPELTSARRHMNANPNLWKVKVADSLLSAMNGTHSASVVTNGEVTNNTVTAIAKMWEEVMSQSMYFAKQRKICASNFLFVLFIIHISTLLQRYAANMHC
jgi:hypothetical protein